MATFKDSMTLVSCGRAKHPEHRHLCRRVRQIEVLTPIHHQHGLFHSRREVDGVCFGRHLPGFESPGQQYPGAQSGFDGQIHGS